MTEQALRDCPWCGIKPEIYPLDPKKDGNAWAEVRCHNVDCVANPIVVDGEEYAADYIDYKQIAINKWNTRAYDAELEELRNIKKHYEHLRFLIQNQINGIKLNIKQIRRDKNPDFNKIKEMMDLIVLYDALLDLSSPDFALIAQTVEPASAECGGSIPSGRK